jgi:Tol biopolymer transport system component
MAVLKHQGYTRFVLLLLLAACSPESWERDPQVQAAKKACKGPDEGERYACIERHAVESLNPDICRLASIWIDGMCLQAVYEAADDPGICERLYLEGMRPTCRAYYESLARDSTPAISPTDTATNTAMPTLATLTPEMAITPTWRHILFVYNHDGATELWTIDPASDQAQRVIRPRQTIQDPAVSPSGETIAYVRVTGDYGGVVSELWLMDRDGGNPRPLYVPPAERSVLSQPAWQPDGRAIYFQQLGSGTGDYLLRIPVIGGEPTTVLTDCLDFALSPDEQWLASMNLDRQLGIFWTDGSRLRDIEPQGAGFAGYYSLAASPDGNLLAFRAAEAKSEDTWNLYVMDWSGRDLRRLTDLKGFQPFTSSTGQVNGLAWTADGAHLVYSVDGHPEQSGIWLIGLDDGQARRLFTWQEGEWAAVQGSWVEPGSPYPNWLTYTHSIYGFSFRYPPDWYVVSKADVPNALWLRHKEQPSLELSIGFRRSGEETPIQRTGVGAGEIETQGSVRFLGRELSRDVLIYEGKVKAALYNHAQEIDVDGLIFTLSLDDHSLDYDAAEIKPEMQAIVDEVIGSFLLSSDAPEP